LIASKTRQDGLQAAVVTQGGSGAKVITHDEHLDATCNGRGSGRDMGGLIKPYLGMISLSPDKKSPGFEQQDAGHVVCETRIAKLTPEKRKV
jgi:hypothetical protein